MDHASILSWLLVRAQEEEKKRYKTKTRRVDDTKHVYLAYTEGYTYVERMVGRLFVRYARIRWGECIKVWTRIWLFLLIVSLILFDQSVREGLIRFPSFSGYKNNMESGAHFQLPI
jgi:hypothetical protein